ncbi:hypothetical protein DFP73DRAFT_592396 [Morchella snyderi]|nr:hypothetical protein DFP73DRAFT_592396 [Morchella snyderi]
MAYWLPQGEPLQRSPYHLVEVPGYFEAKNLDYRIKDNLQIPQSKLNICYNHSIIKIVAAIFQTLYGSYELFRARESQLERYGFAAYSLSVIPYIMMSLINLLAALIEPEYPMMYLVYYGGEAEPEKGDVILGDDVDEEEARVSPGAHGYHHLKIREGVSYALIELHNQERSHGNQKLMD